MSTRNEHYPLNSPEAILRSKIYLRTKISSDCSHVILKLRLKLRKELTKIQDTQKKKEEITTGKYVFI